MAILVKCDFLYSCAAADKISAIAELLVTLASRPKAATLNVICPKSPYFALINMYFMLCLCASEALLYVCSKMPFVSIT